MQEINLTQNTFELFPTVYAVQNDTGRELQMNVQDRTLAATDTATVAVNRSDGSYYTIEATIDTASNSATADISQALTQPGKTLCQLKITDASDLIVSSYTFCIMVQPSTDGVPEEQLGVSVQDLMEAAAQIEGGGITDAIKEALLAWCAKTVFVDDSGPDIYQALYDALYPPRNLSSISCVYTQGGTVYDTDTLDSLKADLVVTAHYDDSSTSIVTTYVLSGTLTPGTSTITVSYGGKNTTFTVSVTHNTMPAGYTEYGFVKGVTSAGAIVTSAQMKAEYSYEFKFFYPSGTGQSNAMPQLGARTASYGTKEFAFFITPTTGKLGYWFGGTDSTTNITITPDVVHTIKVLPVGKSTTYPTKAVIVVDGTEYDTGSTKSSETWSSWFAIFGYATSASSATNSILFGQRIGRISVTDGNGDAVYDFIPVDNGANKIGYYEAVSETFYEADKTKYEVGNWS